MQSTQIDLSNPKLNAENSHCTCCLTVANTNTSQLGTVNSRFIQEFDDKFLALFPHRYDYISANHPVPGQKPEWKTESKHPLSDRLIIQGSCLYGVRVGSNTGYQLIDIDRGSQYHPQRDPFAIPHLVAALEPLGITDYIPITSSHSGGIHLYFPLDKPKKCHELAQAVQTLLESAGFVIAPGQLELFPSDRGFGDGKPMLHAAHRLPLQLGSYLLDREWEPIYTTQAEFVSRWHFCQRRNWVSQRDIKKILNARRKHHPKLRGSASKLLNDLNAEVEPGWTGRGQTNRILGRIAYRIRVFHHTLNGGAPLEGDALIDEIVKVAKVLPGYREFCCHQHEIRDRATDWARAAERRYYPYSRKKARFRTGSNAPERTLHRWQAEQQEGAQRRIKTAIAQMLEAGSLPAKATARYDALRQHGIGGATLYKYKNLWHPEFLLEDDPPDPPICPSEREKDAPECASLLCSNTSDTPLEALFKGFKPRPSTPINSDTYRAMELAQKREQHIIKMRGYRDSDDPILIRTAAEWAAHHPGLL